MSVSFRVFQGSTRVVRVVRVLLAHKRYDVCVARLFAGHGTCISSSGQCDCFTGYTGPDCSDCTVGWVHERVGSHVCILGVTPDPPPLPPLPPSPSPPPLLPPATPQPMQQGAAPPAGLSNPPGAGLPMPPPLVDQATGQ
eukprot:1181838-Prorocentrum_minimum.AAC.2